MSEIKNINIINKKNYHTALTNWQVISQPEFGLTAMCGYSLVIYSVLWHR